MVQDKTKKLLDLFSPYNDEKLPSEEGYSLYECDCEMLSNYEGCFDGSFEEQITENFDLNSFVFPSSFVSLDFENLYPQRVTACSVGMVKYKNGIIVDKYYTLIRPPFEYEGKSGPVLTWIHGFTENDFEGQRTFAEILPEMESFIDGLPLVAHNACVERACIHDACAYYSIQTSIPYENIIDTYLLSKYMDSRFGINIKGEGFHSLNVVCQRYGVKVLRHHHACDDAEMCGSLFLVFPKYLSGELTLDETAWKLIAEYSSKEKSTINPIYQSFEARGHTSLSGDILQKDLSCADPNNPFYDRKVVITGVFNIERQELANRLKTMGADIDTGVGSKTNYLLIGEEPGPSKLRKFDKLIATGKDVRKIYQEDLDLILAGMNYEKYHTETSAASKLKANVPKERKTTWPNLVKKFKQYVSEEGVEFTEREMQSEDYRLLCLYYKQQQKVATTKDTVLLNLRELDDANEREFKKDILACFVEGEDLTKEFACKRMQNVFTKYGLQFKAKTCVLIEFGVDFKEYKDDKTKILHITINKKPQE